MADWIRDLDKLSLRGFSRLYEELALGRTADLVGAPFPKGVYKGTYVGPGWLKAVAPPSMVVSGLGGWWGKVFKAGGETYNLVKQAGEIKPVFPMQLLVKNSRLDGLPALALLYDKRNPFPWPHVVDELRPLDETALLGMMYLNVRAFPKMAFPFLIQKIEKDIEVHFGLVMSDLAE